MSPTVRLSPMVSGTCASKRSAERASRTRSGCPGRTVSPTLMVLEVMTPANAALRITRSAVELASEYLARATLHCASAASYCATEITSCSLSMVARARSRVACSETARVCSRRASTSRAESLTRTSPARTGLPSPTRTSRTVPLISGAIVALRVARTVPTTSVTTVWVDRSAFTTRTCRGGGAGACRGEASATQAEESPASARTARGRSWPAPNLEAMGVAQGTRRADRTGARIPECFREDGPGPRSRVLVTSRKLVANSAGLDSGAAAVASIAG